MKKLDDLIEKYPEAFHKDYPYPFQCMDGWHDIIEPAVIAIKDYNNSISAEEKENNEYWQMYPVQVKEKFGSLRFYTNFNDKSVNQQINTAEKLSEITCEICGKSGELIKARWLYTACPEHTKEGDITYRKFVEMRDKDEQK